MVELLVIAWIRRRYMDTPWGSALIQVIVGGLLVFLAGILIGPHVLGWMAPNEVLRILSDLGVMFLLFRVGLEIKASELLSKNAQPSDAEIRKAMNGHLCRCGTYPRVLKAIQRASRTIAGVTK